MRRIINLFIGLIALVFVILGMIDSVNEINNHNRLKVNGIRDRGSLEMATKKTFNLIFVDYRFKVRYQNKVEDFDVDSSLFDEYVKDGKFIENAPIDVIYLSSHNHASELAPMLKEGIDWWEVKKIAGYLFGLIGALFYLFPHVFFRFGLQKGC